MRHRIVGAAECAHRLVPRRQCLFETIDLGAGLIEPAGRRHAIGGLKRRDRVLHRFAFAAVDRALPDRPAVRASYRRQRALHHRNVMNLIVAAFADGTCENWHGCPLHFLSVSKRISPLNDAH